MTEISIDPGDNIGVIISNGSYIKGITITGSNRNEQLWVLLRGTHPDIVIYEEFALRQSSATKLVGNKFITCEVIGVIKLYCQLYSKRLVPLIPANKQYCGFSSNPKDKQYITIQQLTPITEHVRDAYRLYCYAKLFKGEQIYGENSKG